jgi:hypothetical protein
MRAQATRWKGELAGARRRWGRSTEKKQAWSDGEEEVVFIRKKDICFLKLD